MKIRIITLCLSALVAILVFSQSIAQQPDTTRRQPPAGNPLALYEHPKNLKVLPKHIPPQELQTTMRTWARSLGVRCGFCHAEATPNADKKPELNFASDAKDEKRNARKMFTMVGDINHKYLGKMDKSFEQITCVSCHHGSPKPMISVDSLPKPVGK